MNIEVDGTLGQVRDLLKGHEFASRMYRAWLAKITENGRKIDSAQAYTELLAVYESRRRAADALVRFAERTREAKPEDSQLAAAMSAAYAADLLNLLHCQRMPQEIIGPGVCSVADDVNGRVWSSPEWIEGIGRAVIERKGVNNGYLGSEELCMVRDTYRALGERISVHAERVHRHDELVPEEVIAAIAAEYGFSSSIPEDFGGMGLGKQGMCIITEELSRSWLAGAGSLITRPEILSSALLQGGTEEQKRKWLPKIASGEIMVAISVTEPDHGSDVASITCKAERAEVGGVDGYKLNGAKAWCTFAGRANVMAMLCRTDPDPSQGMRGLSLFIVEKDAFDGHAFEMKQTTGGRLIGKADATPGYRGMHSFTLSLEDYLVPAENLVGMEGGLNKGFFLQMIGFNGGRLQTGARATGLSQFALELAAKYSTERKQFRRPIADYQLTQYKLGWMAVYTEAGRQLTYEAAAAMDADDNERLMPAAAKLVASRHAVEVTQTGQLLHGGWGYAEEYPISRCVLDALVLPIFEGVEPILALKVIGPELLKSMAW